MSQPQAMRVVPLSYDSPRGLRRETLLRIVLWAVVIASAADLCSESISAVMQVIRMRSVQLSISNAAQLLQLILPAWALIAAIDALHRHSNGHAVVIALVALVAFHVGFAVLWSTLEFRNYPARADAGQILANAARQFIGAVSGIAYPVLLIWILRRPQIRSIGAS